MLVVVDTGPLVAAFNDKDRFHRLSARLLTRTDIDFVVPALCMGEAAYLIARDLGPALESRFVAGCGNLDLRLPDGPELVRMSELMDQYLDFPIGAVDASVVALAESLGAVTVATLDHRHFGAIRPKHVEAFTLLPEL